MNVPLFDTLGTVQMRCRRCHRNTPHRVRTERGKHGGRILIFKCQTFFSVDYCKGEARFVEDINDAVMASKLRTLAQELGRALTEEDRTKFYKEVEELKERRINRVTSKS